MRFLTIFILAYMPGFLATFAINLASGPLTFGLVCLRAALWPIWIATGHPHGTPLQMD